MTRRKRYSLLKIRGNRSLNKPNLKDRRIGNRGKQKEKGQRKN
jgi:hypothetical protein